MGQRMRDSRGLCRREMRGGGGQKMWGNRGWGGAEDVG